MKKVFAKVHAFVVMLLGGEKKVEDFVLNHADEAIAVVTNIRSFINGPIFTALELLLPPQYKNAVTTIMPKFESTIDSVLTDLGYSKDCLSKATTLEKMQCFIDALKAATTKQQDLQSIGFAQLYTKAVSATDLPDSVVDHIVQTRVTAIVNKTDEMP